MPDFRNRWTVQGAEVFSNSLLSLLTAGFLLLIFPRFDLRFLAPVGLSPLLIAMARTRDGWQRFVYGWGAGIFYWFFLCTWIQFVLEVHGGMGRWGGWGCFLLFCVLKALHLAVFAVLGGPLMRAPHAVLTVPALWVGLERTHATFGFAWLDLGNAGISMSLPLRLAPLIGVYGLSFVFCMLAAAVACAILRYPRQRLTPLLLLVGLWALPPVIEGVPARRAAVAIQPNIDPEIQWTEARRQTTELQLNLLSEVSDASLVIWPELPAPLYYYEDREFRDLAQRIARRHGYFLFGTVAYTTQHEPLNSALLLGRDGIEMGRYDKINLVPFGEFVPPLFSFVNRITQEAGDFVPGHDIKVLPAGAEHLGVFICYESAFPDLVRRFAQRGANVLVNLSNDAYFGHSEAHAQHLSIVRMRAVENRRYIIRATNDGISAIIDPAGNITQRLPMYAEVSSLFKYGLVEDTTFYARHGDWFAWGCLLAGIGFSALNLAPRFARRPEK